MIESRDAPREARLTSLMQARTAVESALHSWPLARGGRRAAKVLGEGLGGREGGGASARQARYGNEGWWKKSNKTRPWVSDSAHESAATYANLTPPRPGKKRKPTLNSRHSASR